MSVLLRVEQLFSSFKRFAQKSLNMTPRVLDYTMIQTHGRDDFIHYKEEVLKLIKFYNNIIQSGNKTGVYQYSLIANARKTLQTRGIWTIDRELVCNYRTNFILPVLVLANEQAGNLNLEDVLIATELDYLNYLTRSVPFIDQLRYGECMITALGKWTQYADLVKRINVIYELLGFFQLKYLTDTRL